MPSPPHTSSVPWAAWLALASSMALVGSYVGLSKLLVAAFPVFLLAWLRFGIAAVAMLHWLRRVPGEAPLSRRDRVLLFWESFIGNFLFSICMLYGVMATSALAAGVVMAAIPAAVALLARLFLGERIAPRIGAAIACAGCGIALLALARSPGGGAAAPWWGYALLLGAVVCEASYVVIGKRLTAQVSARRISALINLWGLLVFYALAASMFSVWLWMQGLRHVPAPQAGVFTVMLPVSAALVGVWFLDEPLGAPHAAAFALALAGLLLATWPGRAGAGKEAATAQPGGPGPAQRGS